MSEDKKERQRKQGAIRQARKRERDKARGKPITFIPSESELRQIELNCEFRGGLVGISKEEYILTLIRRDSIRIENERGVTENCKFCLEPYPKGCRGKWAGRRECYHTTEAKKHSLEPKNLSW